jgi:CubicO group peptidase (beta-lactamase class C family)
MTDHVGSRSPFPAGLGWGFGGAVRSPKAAAQTGLPEQYGWTGGGYSVLSVSPVERIVAYFIFPVMPPGDNDLLNDFRARVAAAMAN